MPGQPCCAQWGVGSGEPEIFGHSCLVKRPTTGRARFMQASFIEVGYVGFNIQKNLRDQAVAALVLLLPSAVMWVIVTLGESRFADYKKVEIIVETMIFYSRIFL
jgi:hypothetical protein